jgi:MFS family permease
VAANPVNHPPHYRRNFIALVVDFAGFGLGFAFYSPSTVLPAFVSELTSSAPLVGLISTVLTGAWLLPQLIAANVLAHHQRQKPYVILSSLVGRSSFFVLAATTYLYAGRRPTLTLVVFYLCLTTFMSCDAVTSVGWFDMWPKMIPSTRRGRFMGLGQVLAGVMTIGAAELVRRILSSAGPPFPANYSLLFVFAGAAMMVSVGALAFLREPPGESDRRPIPWREFPPRLARMLREDRDFRMLNIVRLLAGVGGVAAPFYIVYATSELGMATETIALFITAQTVGSIAAGLILGYLNERWGSRIVIQVSRVLSLAQPLLALTCAGLYSFLGADLASQYVSPAVYAIVFLLMGIINSSMMPGFLSYLVDMAPEQERPVYIGLCNTLSGLLMVVPLAGGWLLEATSYSVLFIAAAAGSALSLLFAMRMAEVRERALGPGN